MPVAVGHPSVASAFVGVPWAGVSKLLRRGTDLEALRAHRLQLLEAQRLRELGRELPDDLSAEADGALRSTLLVQALLSRVRELCDGPILVFKGPEAAASYPEPWLRPYIDVDILVTDARDAERRLRAAGFRGVGPEMDWDTLHHVQRLVSPDVPAAVEVHRRPKWVAGAAGPSIEELLEEAVPSATGVDGLLAPSPEQHAVLLAAHAWAERPLGRLGDLIDVAAVLEQGTGGTDELARRYGIARVWRATLDAIDSVIVHDRRTWTTSTWARHLPEVRERTVAESHVARFLEPFTALPLPDALRGAGRALGRTLLPHHGEGWRVKLGRSRKALRSAGETISGHQRSLERDPESDE